jgi:hypothetical protein
VNAVLSAQAWNIGGRMTLSCCRCWSAQCTADDMLVSPEVMFPSAKAAM